MNIALYVRVECLKQNVLLSMLCQIVVGPQFQNVMSYNVAFSENVDCYPKMSNIFVFSNLFICPWNEICFLACFKAKNEEKLKQN